MQKAHSCLQQVGRIAEFAHRPAPYRQRARPRTACCSSQQPQDADLAGAFSSFLLQSGQAGQRAPVTPSPLLPPHSVVAAQMEALQRNDYPEADAGLQTAYRFSKPYGSESLMIGQVPSSFSRVRSWGAAEEWLTPKEFASVLNSPPYHPMVGCESWRAASGIVFTSTRHNNKAVQAVHVTAAPTLYPPFPGASSFGQDDHPGLCNTGGDSVFGVSSSIQGASSKPKVHTFTFCLERVDEGALKGIWYTVGVRVGDYTV